MILITSTLGATNRYPDQQVMRKTFALFLQSLDNQTSENFRLFLACHDRPEGFDRPYVTWCSVREDKDCTLTRAWKRVPVNLEDSGETKILPYNDGLTDMSRKSYHGAIEAGRWAGKEGLKEFWVLRMDADDMLANDVVEFLDKSTDLEAMYNRTCHMYDFVSGQMAEHHCPYSTTCNALKMKIKDGGWILPNWYYHCYDHTKFWRDVKRDGFRSIERDWNLCITTNSGNSLSGRPAIEQEKHNTIIPLTQELCKRYGIEK